MSKNQTPAKQADTAQADSPGSAEAPAEVATPPGSPEQPQQREQARTEQMLLAPSFDFNEASLEGLFIGISG